MAEFGIVSIGTAFGEKQLVAETAGEYVQDTAAVLRWGYHSYFRAPPSVSATDLAAQACHDALERAGVSGDEVDLIIFATSEMPEYHYWDPAAALAQRLRINRPVIWSPQSCAAGGIAMSIAAGQLALRKEMNTVLLAVSNRVSEAHRSRMKTNTCVGSDGAAALVLRRAHPALRWLGFELLTDPEFADFFRLEFGGERVPQTPAGWTPHNSDLLAALHEHFGRDPVRFKAFVDTLNGRIGEVVDTACHRAGFRRDQLARLIYLNDNQSALADIGQAMGIGLERTNAEVARDYGHMGAADQFVALRHHLDHGELVPGDLVALAGISSGMHWYCTVLAV